MSIGDIIFLIKARLAHKRVGIPKRNGTVKIYDFSKKKGKK